jgi:hypothetical protein
LTNGPSFILGDASILFGERILRAKINGGSVSADLGDHSFNGGARLIGCFLMGCVRDDRTTSETMNLIVFAN